MATRRKKLEGKALLDYLMSRTEKTTRGCFEWLGRIEENGYVKVSYHGRPSWAHRVVYELANAESPGSLDVMHKCDNRRCINPNHLELGTRADNMMDCLIKDRWHTEARMKAPRSARKLAPSHVMAIRTKDRNGESSKSIAKEFGIDCTMVRMILNLKMWADLP